VGEDWGGGGLGRECDISNGRDPSKGCGRVEATHLCKLQKRLRHPKQGFAPREASGAAPDDSSTPTLQHRVVNRWQAAAVPGVTGGRI
jgi:hypothetical protein